MKKYNFILAIALMLGAISCSNEYEMPDYSNATTSYNREQLASGIVNTFRDEYAKYDIETVNYVIEEETAIEKDADGISLYDGEARGRANLWSKSLNLTYTVKLRGRSAQVGRYFDIEGKYERTFDIDVSPFRVQANVRSERVSYLPIFYNVKRTALTNMLIDKVHDYNYEFSDCITFITERDKEGKELARFEHDPLRGMIAPQEGTETIDVEMELYGRAKAVNADYHEEVKIGTFVLRGIKLADISFTTLELTTDIQYEFIEEPGLITFYNVKNSLPTINKANELGYEFSSWKMYITEKDSNGNVLKRFEHESIKGMIAAQEGAKTIDVEVEVYGWLKENGRTNYNKKEKVGTFVVKDIKLSEIINSTLELSDSMQYEFVRE